MSSSVRLGRLLLKGLTRKKKRNSKKGSEKRKKRGRKKRYLIEKPKPQSSRNLNPSKEVSIAPVVKVTPIVSSTTEPKAQGEINLNEFLHPSEALRSSLEGFILNQRSDHTQKAYTKDIGRFLKFLARRKHQQALGGEELLTRTVFIAYKSALLEEKLEHTTVDRHLATLRSLCQWLEEDGLLNKNPMRQIRFLKPKRLSKTQGFSDTEVKKILTLPNLHTRTGAQHYAILMILFYCGLRRGELCQLRTSQLGVEQEHRVLRLRGKGNKERVIPLIRAVWNAIQYFFMITGKRPGEDQFLFTPIRNNRSGVTQKPLDPSMIYYIVTKYADLAGVANKVSPHSCRATAISNARDQQVSDRAIQEFAGWSSPDMITRYDKRKTAVKNSAAHAIRYGTQDRDLPRWTSQNQEIISITDESENPPNDPDA